MTQDISSAADELHSEFEESGVEDISRDEIEERLDTLVNQYSVQLNQAIQAIRGDFLEDSSGSTGGSATESTVGDLHGDGNAVTLEATVDELWEAKSEYVVQVGLIGDPTGRTKFTVFGDDLPTLEEGESYRFENALTDVYEGSMSVKFNEQTSITQLDEDIEVGENSTSVSGCLVNIADNSGLVKRCGADGCTRVIQNGVCNEHGEVEGEHDLRIKGTVDTGDGTHEFIMDAETTEAFAGMSLEDAVDIAQEALDKDLPGKQLREEFVGTYLSIEGPTYKSYILVEEFETGATATAEQVDELLTRARGLA